MQDSYFIKFKTDTSEYSLPEKFTFPFSYEPHPLTELAANELQENLKAANIKNEISGKMYGVLVVQNQSGELGYLTSFSGQDYDGDPPVNFVPPIYDRLELKGFYKKGEEELVKINRKIKQLEEDRNFNKLMAELKEQSKKSNLELKSAQEKKQMAKALRKEKREEGMVNLSPEAFDKLDEQLRKESINEDYNYKKLNKGWKKKIASIQSKVAVYESQIQRLKKERKQRSIKLQKQIFDQYQFLNVKGQRKGLEEIFEPLVYPPSGAGDCALPKLLQYAFVSQYKPIAMGEFWWGKAPKSELRKEGRFYPACSGKCKPILGHMLKGLNLEDDPLLQYTAEDKVIEKLYEDEQIVVIVKPAGLLSIPSKEIKDSVLTRMQKTYPKATGPLLAHRLDKMTSGIMLISKDLDSHKFLQKQFMDKTIQKRYCAVLEGTLDKSEGEVNLPLAVDEDNRPMQKVDFESGRKALTKWRLISNNDKKSMVTFIPVTGRTHQLRVHAAHPKGLDAPIIGDTLYGNKAERLMLHAEYIQFKHPQNGRIMQFENMASFGI
ncbi:RNA pseudouridine synthase [Marivirga tractuosa]|uniref:Pseudouridine synthase n=1 Tax=Marivirga tractuosa (strain ATCC 23168 / DSM 4126 / NBRC 15989 / NCIMB 1408 / VKM B-1430 / H-43) TaxID=643867 RepID=E4TV58_MARTH|nr:RluA family pseudouridine synthase [Marivirga tractuosa]ADR22151.1 pseudouridine synthase [Marivirga tractuosa DSM 4126]BDD13386.1 RNA pseudouridine synthase [Marivirga tractuosa]